jgi:hypothetical protein
MLSNDKEEAIRQISASSESSEHVTTIQRLTKEKELLNSQLTDKNTELSN